MYSTTTATTKSVCLICCGTHIFDKSDFRLVIKEIRNDFAVLVFFMVLHRERRSSKFMKLKVKTEEKKNFVDCESNSVI